MQNKHRHHKQPKLYLKGFAAKDDEHPNTPSIWVYKKDEQLPKRKGIDKTAFTRDFYAFVEEDGSINYNLYEDLLMKDFEQPANSILGKIRRFEIINNSEKEIFARYIASMITRGDYGKYISEHSMELAIKQNFDANSNLPESVLREAENQLLRLKESGKIFKEQIISKALLIESYIVKMNWKFYTAPKNLEYFTSDNPVFHRQLIREEGEVIFPISSNLALYASSVKGKDGNYERANDKIIESIRDVIARIAIREVYSSQRREWLVKFINNR